MLMCNSCSILCHKFRTCSCTHSTLCSQQGSAQVHCCLRIACKWSRSSVQDVSVQFVGCVTATAPSCTAYSTLRANNIASNIYSATSLVREWKGQALLVRVCCVCVCVCVSVCVCARARPRLKSSASLRADRFVLSVNVHSHPTVQSPPKACNFTSAALALHATFVQWPQPGSVVIVCRQCAGHTTCM